MVLVQLVTTTCARLKQQNVQKMNTYLCVTYVRNSFVDTLSTSTFTNNTSVNQKFLAAILPSLLKPCDTIF